MKKLSTIKIKGKEYTMVNQRVLGFNEDYKNGSIITMVKKDEGNVLRMIAIVTPDVANPSRKFTGHSEIVRDITKGLDTAQLIETVETSAIGRALGMMGIGILEGIASADEVAKAIGSGNGRLATDKQKSYLQEMLVKKGLNFLTDKELETLTMDEASKLIEKYKFKPKHYAANDRDFTADEEGGDKYEAIREANEETIKLN